jgi:hypothetical protein
VAELTWDIEPREEPAADATGTIAERRRDLLARMLRGTAERQGDMATTL